MVPRGSTPAHSRDAVMMVSDLGEHLGPEQLARVEDLQAQNAALVIKLEVDHAADLLRIHTDCPGHTSSENCLT